MTKWEAARYFIDAKKCIDSVWYIAENGKYISNINLRKKIEALLREFYINCCVVLDETHNKKILCQANPTIDRIYYERDKDKAHKDANYKPIKFSSLLELRDIMKNQLSTVHSNCSSVLPDNITLNYVPHDKELFRLVHTITAEKEEKIKEAKYPLYNKINPDSNDSQAIIRTVFHDTEDIRDIPDDHKEQYAVVIESGINMFEGLQERQDACIRFNVLFNENMWCSITDKDIEISMKLTNLGLLDIFSTPNLSVLNNKDALEEFYKIIQGEADFEN